MNNILLTDMTYKYFFKGLVTISKRLLLDFSYANEATHQYS